MKNTSVDFSRCFDPIRPLGVADARRQECRVPSRNYPNCGPMSANLPHITFPEAYVAYPDVWLGQALRGSWLGLWALRVDT